MLFHILQTCCLAFNDLSVKTYCHVACGCSLIRLIRSNCLTFRKTETVNIQQHLKTDSQHSSLMTHFSLSSVWSWHRDPSSGYCLTYRSRDLIPIPQDTLQADQLIHSDIIHVAGSVQEQLVIFFLIYLMYWFYCKDYDCRCSCLSPHCNQYIHRSKQHQ